jgi:hypothetical protein
VWQPVGVVNVTATTDRADFGEFSADLDQGRLWVRLSTSGAAGIRPLAFGIVGLIADDDTEQLGTAKYYPDQFSTVVQLGPGPYTAVRGRLFFRPRSYNQRWLSVGLPSAVWTVTAEVLSQGSVTDPAFNASGLRYRLRSLVPGFGPIGPRKAWRLKIGN